MRKQTFTGLVTLGLFVIAVQAQAYLFWLPAPTGRTNPDDPRNPNRVSNSAPVSTNTPTAGATATLTPTNTVGGATSTPTSTPNPACSAQYNFEGASVANWYANDSFTAPVTDTAQTYCGAYSMMTTGNFASAANHTIVYRWGNPGYNMTADGKVVTWHVRVSPAMPAGSDLKLIMSSGGYSWVGYVGTVSSSTGNTWLTVTYDFTGYAGITFSNMNELVLNCWIGGPWTGSVWIDEVGWGAVSAGTSTPTSTPTTAAGTSTPTPTATATSNVSCPAQFNFESASLANWYANDSFTAPVTDTAQTYCGSYSMMTTGNFGAAASHTIVYRWGNPGYNMTADGKVVTWHVRVSPAMPAGSDLKLIMSSGGYSWVGYVGTVASDTGNTWLTVTYDFTGYAGVTFSNMNELVLNCWVAAPWTGSVWIDEVGWGAAPVATATYTPTATFTVPAATATPTYTPTPNASCPAQFNFESTSLTNWYANDSFTAPVTDTAQTYCGSYSMMTTGSFGAAANHTIVYRWGNPGYNMTADGKVVTWHVRVSPAMPAGSDLKLIMSSGGYSWVGYVGTVASDTGNTWLTVTYDFTGYPGVNFSNMNELVLNCWVAAPWTGSLWVDEVGWGAAGATATPTTTAIPATATPTSTPTNTPVVGCSAQFNFEGPSAANWVGNDSFTAPITDTAQAYCGTYSLKTTGNFGAAASHTLLYRWGNPGYNMSADGKVVTWHVRVSPAMPAGSDLKLIMSSGGYSWNGYVGTVAADTGDTWLTLSYDFTGYPGVNFANMNELVLNVYVAAPWTGTLWVDEVSWSATAPPTATPTPTGGTNTPTPTLTNTPACNIPATDGSDFEGGTLTNWSNPGWDTGFTVTGLAPATDQTYCGTYSAACTASYTGGADDGFIIYDFPTATDLTAINSTITFHIRVSPAMPAGSGFNIAIADSSYAWAGYLGWTPDPSPDTWFTVSGNFSATAGVTNCRQIILLCHTAGNWTGKVWIDQVTW